MKEAASCILGWGNKKQWGRTGEQRVIREVKPEREMHREEEEGTKLLLKAFVLSPWLERKLLGPAPGNDSKIIWFRVPYCMYFSHTFIFSLQWSKRQVLLLSPFTDRDTRLRDVKQLAPQDRDRMRHMLATITDATPLSSLSHRGNVECG